MESDDETYNLSERDTVRHSIDDFLDTIGENMENQKIDTDNPDVLDRLEYFIHGAGVALTDLWNKYYP